MDLYVLTRNGSNMNATSPRFGVAGQVVVKERYGIYRLLHPREGQYGYDKVAESNGFGLNEDRLKKL